MAKRSVEEREKLCNSLFVSFSKRRKGLFQKAAELCTKCNAQLAVVVLSPTGNPFAFGHSSVDEVLQHYLGKTQTTISSPRFVVTQQHKHQTQRIQGLKFSLKQGAKNDRESYVVQGLKNWIETEFGENQTLQELELLREKYKTLLGKITERLGNSSGDEIGTIGSYESSRCQKIDFLGNDVSFSNCGSSSGVDHSMSVIPGGDGGFGVTCKNSDFVENDVSYANFEGSSVDCNTLGFPGGDGGVGFPCQSSDFFGNDVSFDNYRSSIVDHNISEFPSGTGFTCPSSDFVGDDFLKFTSSDMESLDHHLNDMSFLKYDSNHYSGDESFNAGSSVDHNILDLPGGVACQNSKPVGNDVMEFTSSDLEFLHRTINDMSYANYGSSSSSGDARVRDGSSVDHNNILDLSGGGFTCQNSELFGDDMFQFTSSDLEFLDHPLNDVSYNNRRTSGVHGVVFNREICQT